MLVGFRTVQFDQNLDVAGATVLPRRDATLPGIPNTVNLNYQDSFWVHDRFYGPQIGLDTESTCKRFFLNVKAKFAAGEMDETFHINGVTTFTGPARRSPAPSGRRAGPALEHRRLRPHLFTFLPELTVNAGVQTRPTTCGPSWATT